jgi:hypothetical protein
LRIAFLVGGNDPARAARDLRIIRALGALVPEADIAIASSASGLRYFRSRSADCTDLGIADGAEQASSASWRVWRHLHLSPAPDLVVADEVNFAIPYCRKILDVPCVVLADGVDRDAGKPHLDRLLDDAAEILVLNFPPSRPGPVRTTAPVSYLGPVVEEFTGPPHTLAAAPGLSRPPLTAVASFGAAPARHLLKRTLQSWNKHAEPGDRLFILAEEDSSLTAASAHAGVRWAGITQQPESYYRMADVVLTSAPDYTSCELTYNQIPAVAFSSREAAQRYPRSSSHRLEALAGAGAVRVIDDEEGPGLLWRAIAGARQGRSAQARARDRLPWARPHDVAQRLLKHVGG